MRLENKKYSEGVNISGGELSGGWNVWGWTICGVKHPGGETSWGETVIGVNHPGGESSVGVKKKNYEGGNRPGVNHKGGETSGIHSAYIVDFLASQTWPLTKVAARMNTISDFGSCSSFLILSSGNASGTVPSVKSIDNKIW